MPHALELRKCAYDCGWMFVAGHAGGTACHPCGGHEQCPRICKTGAEETDEETLFRLAQYTLNWRAPGIHETLYDVVNAKIEERLEAKEPTE